MSFNTPAAGQSAPVANPEAMASRYAENSEERFYNYSTGAVDLPRSWKYRQYRLLGRTFPWYASPKIQLGMVALVCFMCPGMFNALSSMGGGGKVDHTLTDNMVSQCRTMCDSEVIVSDNVRWIHEGETCVADCRTCYRIQLFTARLPFLASLVVPLSTGSV